MCKERRVVYDMRCGESEVVVVEWREAYPAPRTACTFPATTTFRTHFRRRYQQLNDYAASERVYRRSIHRTSTAGSSLRWDRQLRVAPKPDHEARASFTGEFLLSDVFDASNRRLGMEDGI